MKLKNIPIGSTVKMNKSKAVVLRHGDLGTRVNVIEGDPEQVTLGNQIWSNETLVESTQKGKAWANQTFLPKIITMYHLTKKDIRGRDIRHWLINASTVRIDGQIRLGGKVRGHKYRAIYNQREKSVELKQDDSVKGNL